MEQKGSVPVSMSGPYNRPDHLTDVVEGIFTAFVAILAGLFLLVIIATPIAFLVK